MTISGSAYKLRRRFPYNAFAAIKELVQREHRHSPWFISGTTDRLGQNRCTGCGLWYHENTGEVAAEQLNAMEQILMEKLIRGELGA